MIWPIDCSEGIAIKNEVDFDDPMSVGYQMGSAVDFPEWCHRCHTHTGASWVYLTGYPIKLSVCWWCNGPQDIGKTTRTQQVMDQTITVTHDDPHQAGGSLLIEWNDYIAREHQRVFAER